MADRVGLGWRRELALGVWAHLDRIDLLELIADDYFSAPRREVEALETLARRVPVVIHGLGLGLASSGGVETCRLERMARLVERLRPESWSEHLAFVRAGGFEIGHLAAPPRTPSTVEAAARNLRRARAVVGTSPLVENIATLIDPPASCLSEASWIAQILEGSDCPLLLDLHNLYANAVNHGYDAVGFLDRIPIERVGAIHVSGGRWIPAPGGARVLDDHLHDVPEPVYGLLEEVAARARQPLTVILERDGAYPGMDRLLAQLDGLRGAVARGRNRRR